MYVSITGLRVKGAVQMPRFLWHTLGSMRQAQRAPGNLRTDARRIDGVYHTITCWTDRAAMQAYLGAGAHLAALRVSRHIGSGAVAGFDADAAPDWAAVPALLAQRGRNV